MLSTPHGDPADKCVDSLKPHLSPDNAIVDCGSEHWSYTKRAAARPRQRNGGAHPLRGVRGVEGPPERAARPVVVSRCLEARNVRGRRPRGLERPRGRGPPCATPSSSTSTRPSSA